MLLLHLMKGPAMFVFPAIFGEVMRVIAKFCEISVLCAEQFKSPMKALSLLGILRNRMQFGDQHWSLNKGTRQPNHECKIPPAHTQNQTVSLQVAVRRISHTGYLWFSREGWIDPQKN